MFDWVTDALNYIQDLFYGLIDFLLDLATSAFEAIGLAQLWADFESYLGNGSPIDVMMGMVPIAQLMANWDIIFGLVQIQFSILAALCLFKITVKLIPTIW